MSTRSFCSLKSMPTVFLMAVWTVLEVRARYQAAPPQARYIASVIGRVTMGLARRTEAFPSASEAR